MADTEKKLAVFDFDHTLITHDSLWAFFSFIAGWPRTGVALAQSATLYANRWLRDKDDVELKDRRAFLKGQLLKRLISGRSIEELVPVLDKLFHWQRWNETMRQTLLDHHADGCHIVIASGSLSLYLPYLVKDLPHHAVICTEVGVEDDIITGVMTRGNCVGRHKAELLRDYMATHGPFGESWGYGNFPHDIPMLGLLKHRVIV